MAKRQMAGSMVLRHELVCAGVGASLLVAASTRAADLVPVVEAQPSSGEAPLTVLLTAKDSTAAGASGILSYEWDFTYDGQEFQLESAYLSAGTVAYTYDEPGTHTVRLRLTDKPHGSDEVRREFIDVEIEVLPATRDPGERSVHPPDAWGAGINALWTSSSKLDPVRSSVSPVRQVVLYWPDIQPTGPDHYDWSELDKQLAAAAEAKERIALQVNADGLEADHWIFDHVAIMGKTSRQVSPQFWDPQYVAWHHKLLHSLAEHLDSSPHAGLVLYVRNQWNAVYTEGTSCDESYLDEVDCTWVGNSRWVWPPNADEYKVAWSEQIQVQYQRELIDTYFDAFHPLDIPVVLRRNDLPEQDMLELFSSGQPLVWGPMITDNRYDIWDGWVGGHTREFRYMRAWGNLGFMEGGQTAADRAKNSALSEHQESYGTVLRSLAVGLPYIGTYGREIELAADDPAYRDIFAFANRYAGWSKFPKSAPGAWLVLGQFQPASEHFQKVSLTSANWGYFLRQVDAGAHEPQAEIGDSRFGLVARAIGDASVFDVDDAFAEQVTDELLEVRVTYLESSGEPHLAMDHEGTPLGLPVKHDENEDGWRTRTFLADGLTMTDGINGEGDLLLTATRGTPLVHRLEIIRTGEAASGEPPVDAPPVDGGAVPTKDANGDAGSDEGSGDEGCGCSVPGSSAGNSAGLSFWAWTLALFALRWFQRGTWRARARM